MKCKQIIELIETVYKPEHAMDWDNVGLLVGDGEAAVHTVLLALDATEAVIDQAVLAWGEYDHHPSSHDISGNEKDHVG